MDSSFTAVDGMRYRGYGEDRDTGTSLNTDRKFTGQTEDESVGLYWYQSRAYDPEIGRFCSPDPIVPAPGNPQSLNRYSYVYNNPLKYVDPSGHSAEWFNQKWRDDFEKEHGQKPTGSDIDFRYASMKAASQGQDFSVEYWAGQIEQAASSIAGSAYLAVINVPVLWSQAEADIEARVLTGLSSLDESEGNAVKHAYWSGLLTLQYGPAWAKYFTDRHERYGDEHGQKKIDRVMDVYNNKVGRDIAIGLPFYQRDQFSLWARVLQAESEGLLMKIVDGELKPTSPVNNALPLDVIASPHQFRQR